MIGANFADSLPNCYSFADSIKTFEKERWVLFGNSTGNYIEAFLFNVMANADEFFKYFDKVEGYMTSLNETGGLDPQIELVWQQRGILWRVVWL